MHHRSHDEGGLCPGGLCPGGGLCLVGLCPGGLSMRRLCLGGFLSGGGGVPVQGVSVQEVTCLGQDLCPRWVSVQGVSVQGVSVQEICVLGGSVQGVSVQGVSVQEDLCPGGSLLGRPPCSNEQPVYILLECILVKQANILNTNYRAPTKSRKGNVLVMSVHQSFFQSVCSQGSPQVNKFYQDNVLSHEGHPSGLFFGP